MILTRSDIQHLADLARLHVSEEEAERLSRDLTEIVGFIDRASATGGTDTPESAAPMIHPTTDDGVTRSENVDDRALGIEGEGRSADQAPETEQGYVRVPPIAGREAHAVPDDEHPDIRREPNE